MRKNAVKPYQLTSESRYSGFHVAAVVWQHFFQETARIPVSDSALLSAESRKDNRTFSSIQPAHCLL